MSFSIYCCMEWIGIIQNYRMESREGAALRQLPSPGVGIHVRISGAFWGFSPVHKSLFPIRSKYARPHRAPRPNDNEQQ